MFLTGCEQFHLMGDGFCDDSTNVKNCDFDAGDCCIPNKVLIFCEFCKCLGNQTESKNAFETFMMDTFGIKV